MNGLDTYVHAIEGLAEAHGERFRPNPLLVGMAERGETFYGRAESRKAA